MDLKISMRFSKLPVSFIIIFDKCFSLASSYIDQVTSKSVNKFKNKLLNKLIVAPSATATGISSDDSDTEFDYDTSSTISGNVGLYI